VPNGGDCTDGSQCQSGNCADGVCCDTPCTDPLEQCNLPDQAGTCSSTAAIAPAVSMRGLVAAVLLLASLGAVTIARLRRRAQRR
jgi:hypothetical protein